MGDMLLVHPIGPSPSRAETTLSPYKGLNMHKAVLEVTEPGRGPMPSPSGSWRG